MAKPNVKLDPRKELALSALLIIGAIAGWYLMLYQPLASKTNELRKLVDNQQDSLVAIQNYKDQTGVILARIEEMQEKSGEWSSRFPKRTEIVELARKILEFGKEHDLHLIDMKPSLFELYALESAGAQISGKHVMQLPLNVHFQGRFLNFGAMLEQIDTLPFNVTVGDVNIAPVPGKYPLLDFKARLYLYVRI